MKTYSEYMRGFFPGFKVQKISVDAGFSCPNRDGTIGRGGCTYCRVDAFTPGYCLGQEGVAAQIEAGKRFFARKYPGMRYLAYFQAFTNTHGRDTARLRALYEEAASVDGVVGMVVATRPDALPDATLSLLEDMGRRLPVWLEVGAESSHDATLRAVNRGHTWRDVERAVERAAARGLHCGLHLIAGLPGETDSDVLESVERACALPIETLKLHHLQILAGTELERQWREGKADVRLYTVEEYLKLCVRILERVPERIAVDRFLSQSPPALVAAPRWNLKNYQFANMLSARLRTPETQ